MCPQTPRRPRPRVRAVGWSPGRPAPSQLSQLVPGGAHGGDVGGVPLLLELGRGGGKAPLDKEASRLLRREACALLPGDLALEPLGP